MLKRFLTTLALPLLLASCGGFTTPERDNAQWTTELHGVSITWRWTEPGALERRHGPGVAGFALFTPGGSSCVIDIDPVATRMALTRVAAHEAGHCLAGRYFKVGAKHNNPDPHANELMEQWPEAYAQAYLRTCGLSLAPLGWDDRRQATCTAPPNVDDIK